MTLVEQKHFMNSLLGGQEVALDKVEDYTVAHPEPLIASFMNSNAAAAMTASCKPTHILLYVAECDCKHGTNGQDACSCPPETRSHIYFLEPCARTNDKVCGTLLAFMKLDALSPIISIDSTLYQKNPNAPASEIYQELWKEAAKGDKSAVGKGLAKESAKRGSGAQGEANDWVATAASLSFIKETQKKGKGCRYEPTVIFPSGKVLISFYINSEGKLCETAFAPPRCTLKLNAKVLCQKALESEQEVSIQ